MIPVTKLEKISDRLDALTMMFCDLRDSMYKQSTEDANREIYKRWSQLETLCQQLVQENEAVFQLISKKEAVDGKDS